MLANLGLDVLVSRSVHRVNEATAVHVEGTVDRELWAEDDENLRGIGGDLCLIICFPRHYKARADHTGLVGICGEVGDTRNAASLQRRRREGVGRAGIENEDREEMGLAEDSEEKRPTISRRVNELSKEQLASADVLKETEPRLYSPRSVESRDLSLRGTSGLPRGRTRHRLSRQPRRAVRESR